MNNNSNLVRILVESGADIEAQDYDGETALHFASRHGYTSIVYFLPARGADMTAIDNKEQTALMKAQLKNKEEAVALLESYIEKQRLLVSIKAEAAENQMVSLHF